MISLRDDDSHLESTRQIYDLQEQIGSLHNESALVADIDRQRALEEDIVGRV